MTATKVAIAAVLPALIVAGRFVIPALSGSKDNLTWFFAVTGFLATLVGCLAASVPMRRRITAVPHLWITAVGIAVAAALLAIFPTMPNWPFTGVGFIVAWVLMAAGFTAAFLFAVSYRYA